MPDDFGTRPPAGRLTPSEFVELLRRGMRAQAVEEINRAEAEALALDAADREREAKAKAERKALRASRDPEKFLKRTLARGEVLATAVLAKAKKIGIAKRTLERAKKRLRVQSCRKGFGRGSRVFWILPS